MTVIDAALKRLANQRRSAQRYRNQTATARPDFSHSQEFDWREGDIAFLRPSTTFSELDFNCLIASNYLPSVATCHPVIILERRGDDASHVLVTTVSAYGCTSRGPSIAPWKQQCHGGKDMAAFRSFVGSERPNADRPLLRLQENQLMPKPKASWVYLQNVFVVPITVLGKFDKAQRRLRMDKTSLEDLWTQFSGRTQFSKEILADPRLAQSVNGGTVTMKQATAVQKAPPCLGPLSLSCRGPLSPPSQPPSQPEGCHDALHDRTTPGPLLRRLAGQSQSPDHDISTEFTTSAKDYDSNQHTNNKRKLGIRKQPIPRALGVNGGEQSPRRLEDTGEV